MPDDVPPRIPVLVKGVQEVFKLLASALVVGPVDLMDDGVAEGARACFGEAHGDVPAAVPERHDCSPSLFITYRIIFEKVSLCFSWR